MRVYLTGGVRLETGDAVVDHRAFGGSEALLALAYLVCERGRPVARTDLADVLERSAQAPSNLGQLLSNLGQALSAKVPGSELRCAAATVELILPGDTWVDIEAAGDAIHEAETAMRTGRMAAAFGPSAIAHHITRRPFLPGERGLWVEEHRERLRGILVRALETRAEFFLWNSEPSLAIETAREVTRLEPYRESGHRLLMRAFAACGNTAESLRAYERCRSMLRESLGIEPSEETRRVVERLAPGAAGIAGPSAGRDRARRPPPSDHSAVIREVLDERYAIERELAGGMSRVWVAKERALNRRVVIKVLPPEMAQVVAADRFAREVQLAASLQHPNIVPVLSAGVLDGPLPLPYYTMPYVSGESLRAALMVTPQFAIPRALSILRDVARALAFAHSEGVIHRDIKPENILITGDAAVVTDFGIAKAVAETGTAAATRQMLTGAGQSPGTPQYMAPEQLIADPSVDHRADIYAFGVVAYEMLSGHRPFTDGDVQNFSRRLTERPPELQPLRPEIPPALAAAVMNCLETRPEDRTARMSDVMRVLA